MYLHLGQTTTVNTNDIIGIFDLDSVTVSKRGRDFIAEAEKSKNIVNVSFDLPKAFIVTDDGKVYISQISAQTLKKRMMGYDLQ